MSHRVHDIQTFVETAVKDGTVPGVVAQFGRGTDVWGTVMAGSALIHGGHPRPMHLDTIFDVASLTKVTVTLPLVLQLAEQGRIDMGDPVTRYLPEFAGGDKNRVTLAHLLAHSGGLVAHREYFRTLNGYEEVVRAVAEEPLQNAPGVSVIYSDLGYILLGEVIQRVCGRSLGESAQAQIFDVLEMGQTGYKPDVALLSRIAATEVMAEDGKAKVGLVHDDNTEAMGGESGHAGLFSTVQDLGRYLQDWVSPQGRLLRSATKRAALALHTDGLSGRRGWGWVLRGDPQDAMGDFWPPTAAMHTGFTGTSLAFDRDSGLWCVLLTNRVHFGRTHDIGSFRRRFHNVVMMKACGAF